VRDEGAVNNRAGSLASVEQGPSEQMVCLFPQTRAVEVRVPSAFEAADAPRLVWLARRAGFNAILLDCFRSGWTLHPSAAMRDWGFPEQNPKFRGSDPVAAILQAAARERLVVYALVECLKVSESNGRGPILRHHPTWRVRGRRGRAARAPDPPFLCPVNRDVRRFLGDLFYEMMERYGFRGIYLRHLHFPLETPQDWADYCGCDYCRREVWRSLGVKIEEIPDDPDHPDRYNLTSWRVKQLASFLRYLRLRLAKAGTGALTLVELYLGEEGAEVERCGYQDATTWTGDRLAPIAALRPLPGVAETSDSWLEQVRKTAQEALVMPVLSAESGNALLRSIEMLEFDPVIGIVVRGPNDLTAPPLINLPKGPFRRPTGVAEDQPLASICALLHETTKLLPPEDALSAFLADVLRVFEPLGGRWPSAQRKTLARNLLGLEERIASRKINLGEKAAAVLRNFHLARLLLGLVDTES